MFIKNFKSAEINLKILERDRRANIGEWAKKNSILEKHRRRLDSKRRQLDQEKIDDTGLYEKNKIEFKI